MNEADELTEFMQTFCLHPDKEKYDKIINNVKIRNMQADVMDNWQAGCIYKYGSGWGLSDIVLENNQQKYKYLAEAALAKLIVKPTAINLDKVWYLFFSTGEYQYLEACFAAAGNKRSNDTLRDRVLLEYQTVKEKYTDYIVAHNITFTAFDEMQTIIDKNTEILKQKEIDRTDDEIPTDLNNLQFNTGDKKESKLAAPDAEAETGLSEADKLIYREASKKFDDLVKSVLSKIK